MGKKESKAASKRQVQGDEICSSCGSTEFNLDTFWCEECECFVADGPICQSVILSVNELRPCKCVVGIYRYGPDEFEHETPAFAAWRVRHLRPADFDSKDEDPADDFSEVQSLAEETTWMQVVTVADDVAFGHSLPILYSIIGIEDKAKLKGH